MKQLGHVDDVIAFVYKRRDQIVNVKYRTKDKRFSQVTTKCCCCLCTEKCVAKHSSLVCANLLFSEPPRVSDMPVLDWRPASAGSRC